MFPFRNKHVTWNDIIVHCYNHAMHPTEPQNIYCWTVFATPSNEEKPFDRNMFFQYLTMECGNFEPIYPNMEMLLTNLEAWSHSRLQYWQRMYDALCIDYNPIWNYNRYDEDSTHTGRDTERDIGVKSTQDILDKVAGYDSGDLVQNDRTNSDTDASEDYKEGLVENWNRYNHSYGNIGVTTTQKMIMQELEVAQVSMQEIILGEFKETFCLAIF